MKIVAIIGSPRKKGNTYRVVRQIEEKLMEYDKSIGFEYLFLADMNIQMCRGCFCCIAQGEDKCPLRDDRANIELKMQEADGILFAAPNYAMGVPGIMKNFIDRFAYTLHRPCFFDKVFMAVTTSGGMIGIKQALEQLAILSAGGKLAAKLGVSMPPIPMAGQERKAAKDIQKTSGTFYRCLQKQSRRLPGAGDWAYFYAFKTFTTFACYQKVCPADYSYYKEKGEYFYPVKGHYLRRLLGRIFKVLMRISFRLMIKEQTEKPMPK